MGCRQSSGEIVVGAKCGAVAVIVPCNFRSGAGPQPSTWPAGVGIEHAKQLGKIDNVNRMADKPKIEKRVVFFALARREHEENIKQGLGRSTKQAKRLRHNPEAEGLHCSSAWPTSRILKCGARDQQAQQGLSRQCARSTLESPTLRARGVVEKPRHHGDLEVHHDHACKYSGILFQQDHRLFNRSDRSSWPRHWMDGREGTEHVFMGRCLGPVSSNQGLATAGGLDRKEEGCYTRSANAATQHIGAGQHQAKRQRYIGRGPKW